MKYAVWGGEFRDTSFTVQPGDIVEYHGVYDSYQEAYEAWKRGMFSPKLDICTYRLLITPLPEMRLDIEYKNVL